MIMKKIIRFSAASLVIAMLLSLALVSCGGGEVTTASGDSNPTTTEARTILETKTPAGTDFGGAEVKILSRNDYDYYDELTIASDEVSNIIDQSICEREAYVEEKIGVEIKNDKRNMDRNWSLITDIIRDHFRSNINEYQLAASGCCNTLDASFENCFWALSDIDSMSLDMPWYAQNFVEQATLPSGELYFIAGDATISRIRMIYATFVNHSLFERYVNEDIYKVVDDGKWTIDYQYGIASTVYNDENGNGTSDEGDLFGFSAHYNVGIDPYWSAFELPILTKADGKFVEVLDGDRMVDALTKIIDLFYNHNGVYLYDDKSRDPNLEVMMSEFASDHYLFMTHYLVCVEYQQLTEMEHSFGIIPMPKLNEDQSDYYSYSQDQMSVLGIPGTVEEEKLEMIGTVIEELSAYSYNYTREAYYELALKGRYVRDEQSRKMLDTIVDNLYVDAGWLYMKLINNVPMALRTMVRGKNTGWANYYRSQRIIIASGVDKLNGEK